MVPIQDKSTMFIKGGNQGLRRDAKRSDTLNVSELALDFTLKDLKIKLLNKFDRNKFKLNLFLA
jgi:hypothetical protein